MVRTRFAPSPTGYMHIGNLRTALYAFLYARHYGGKFILRIEDTDRKRHVPEALQIIYNSLHLAGIDYDEGPDKDGGVGPYIQSERRELYPHYADILVENGSAYPCFCAAKKETDDSEEVKLELRDPCRYLTAEEVQAQHESGIPCVIRQKIPETGSTSFVDHVFGTITINNAEIEDQVLLKSDGYPTYNFANVVDDHLMNITHVLRGMEYLSSTPKYNLLYQAFGWEIPEYIHLPHITREDGHKLSKRDGDASFEDLLALGFLPEAVVNYIALLGWNPGDDREFLSMAELIQLFDTDHISKSSACFSIAKLDWLNGLHIRALAPEQFHALAKAQYTAEVSAALPTELISALIQGRVVRLVDIPAMIGFLSVLPEFDIELFVHQKSKSTLESSLMVLQEMNVKLAAVNEWKNDVLVDTMKSFGNDKGLKTGTVMWPVRIAISGQQMTPGGATEIAEIIGKDETLRRISLAIERLKTVATATE
ncbi:MAG: glutamate--tRNA ligase [bacterium]